LKWNNLIKFCEENNLCESDAIGFVKKCIKIGTKTQFLLDRFDLYAKERIKQKQKNIHHVHGSKRKAVQKIVDSKKYKDLHKKYVNINCVETKNSCFHILAQLISEPRQNKKLLQVFKNNGERDII
jgi:hypothetical protein